MSSLAITGLASRAGSMGGLAQLSSGVTVQCRSCKDTVLCVAHAAAMQSNMSYAEGSLRCFVGTDFLGRGTRRNTA